MQLAAIEKKTSPMFDSLQPVPCYGSNSRTGLVADFPFYITELGRMDIAQGLMFNFDMSLPCLAQSGVVVVSAFPRSASACCVAFSRNGTSFAAHTRGLAELRDVVSSIEASNPAPVTNDLDALLTRAVQAIGIPSDIHEWAHKLSADISNLTD